MLETIGQAAFWGNHTLDSLKIPASVQAIGESAFIGSTIGELIFEEGSKLSSLGNFAFDANVGTIVGLDEILKNMEVVEGNALAVNFRRN